MDLSELFHKLFDYPQVQAKQADAPGGPPAYTRITKTPVFWGDLNNDTWGQFSPRSGEITMNQTLLPQSNAAPEYMSNILRHESVHALLRQSPQVVAGIKSYLDSNPKDASTMKQGMSEYNIDAGATNQGAAEEAPAYAVQGFRFGLPSERIITEYLKHMPEPIRQKYLQLLRVRGNAPGGR